MHRRHLLALLAAAVAAPGVALAGDARLPLAKAFPMLDVYLALPPAERSRFYLAYRAFRDKRPTGDAHGAIIAANGARAALALDRLGEVMQPPSLAELRSAAALQVDGAPFKLFPEIRCTMAPATRLDAAQLALALAQVNAAVAKVAGALAIMIPKLTAAYFPDAGGGQALTADGHATALPVYTVPFFGTLPYFEPARFAAARTVVLARAPSRILLSGHPKGAA